MASSRCGRVEPGMSLPAIASASSSVARSSGMSRAAEARPLFAGVVGARPCRAHRLLERTRGLEPGPLHPSRLGVTSRDRQHDLCSPRADVARTDGGPEERPRAQLARELRHRLRLPLLDRQPLSRAVAEAREAEADEAVSDAKGREAVADVELQRALDPRHLREDPLAGVGFRPAAQDEGAQLGRCARLRRRLRDGELEPDAEGALDFAVRRRGGFHGLDRRTTV